MVHCISWWLYHNACVVLFCCIGLIDACIKIRLTTFTVDTSVSSPTFACISVHSINACSAVPTWITVAFDYVYDKQLHIRCMKLIFNATRTGFLYWHHRIGIESSNFKYTQLENDVSIRPYIPVSQLVPVYPAAHLHVYRFTPSRHVPPCWHGKLQHIRMTTTSNINFLGITHVLISDYV